MSKQPDDRAREMTRRHGLEEARREARRAMDQHPPGTGDWSFWARVCSHIERLAADRGYPRKSMLWWAAAGLALLGFDLGIICFHDGFG